MTAIQNVQDFQYYQIKLNTIYYITSTKKMKGEIYTREQMKEIFKTLIPLYSNLFSYFKNIYENKKNDIDYEYDYICNSINFNENIFKFNKELKEKKLNKFNRISNLMNDINTIKRIVLGIPNPFGFSICQTIEHFTYYINCNIDEIEKENEEIKLKLIEIIKNLYKIIMKIELN